MADWSVGTILLMSARWRHARWRTWIRTHTPDVLYHRLGLVIPKARDCGAHEWYMASEHVDACYHCRVTRTRRPLTP
jgi:hypothetical protein